MGGNALKNIVSSRMPKGIYEKTSQRVVGALQAGLPGARVEAIASYRTKADFGDLDVIVTREEVIAAGGVAFLKVFAAENLNATDFFHEKNSSCVSFNYRDSNAPEALNFQVDVFWQERATYDYGRGYFGYNDLGNLIGRTADKAGVSNRHDGLYWYYRVGTYLYQEICLTTNYAHMLEFLGFDSNRFAEGFDTLEDIFRFAASSRFFNREVFLLENRNHRARTRDRKRKTYMAFLDWCRVTEGLPAYEHSTDKSEWVPRIEEFFPHFKSEYARISSDLAESKASQELFNGKIVGLITGYSGNKLGLFMAQIRSAFENTETMRRFMLAQTPAQIEAYVKERQKSFELAAEPLHSKV